MISNVTDLTVLRKIRSLEKAIKVKRQILLIKQDYLKKLSQFCQYESIRVENNRVYDDSMRLELTIGMHEQALERLRKEL